MFWLYSFFWRIYSYVQLACGSIPRTWRGNPWFFRILHYAFILVVFLLLSIFSERLIPSASLDLGYPFIERIWCGVLFLLIYLALRLFIALIGLLQESDGSEWPKIDDAWRAGLNGLEREGLDFHSLPLFLLMGATHETEQRFAEGCHCHWNVIEPPLEQPAVIRFYANHECLLIACTGISAASQQARRSTSGNGSVATTLPEQQQVAPPNTSGTMRVTQGPAPSGHANGSGGAATKTPVPPSRGFGGTLRDIASMVQSTLGLSAAAKVGTTVSEHAAVRPLTNADLHLYRLQVQYLAAILKRDRTYCPLNGVLQFIPYSWIVRRQQHSQLVRSVKNDMNSLSEVLGYQFPSTAAIVGLEDVPGYNSFLHRCHRIDTNVHLSRAGSGFPVGGLLDESGAIYVSQLAASCFRDKAYETFIADLDNIENPRVYQFVCELDDQVDNIKHLLQRLGENDPHSPDYSKFCGCYLAAVGDTEDRRAFLHGLLVKLLQEQNYVAYTPRELKRDVSMHRAAIVLFVVAAGLLMLAGYLGWTLWHDLEPPEAPTTLRR
ncbi:MAG: hypothetical protein KDA88_02405 [Planctomycetaceae bacterium]|nr:hypothetical protein [Planctomycetaceae bacterium]MCB9952915.1 hypothetical protein [Planctomycetaceae bacterium]